MRITKKFAGDLAIGRRVFSRMLPTAENEATIAESQKLLAELEAAWLAKLEEMRLEAERVDASNQQQQPNNDRRNNPKEVMVRMKLRSGSDPPVIYSTYSTTKDYG